MTEIHQMQYLGNDVYICPVCFHMVRVTPLEDRKFTIMIEGNMNVQHCGATSPDLQVLFNTVKALERLNKLLDGTPPHPIIYPDCKIKPWEKIGEERVQVGEIYYN